MIYLNQAATTYPKPPTVIKAAEQAMALPPSSQYRTFSGEEAKEDVFAACKEALGALFGISNPRRIVLCAGATDGMNRIVRGLELSGERVAVTQAEHNAVLRCVYNILHGSEIEVIGCDGSGRVCLEKLREKVDENTKAIFVNHCSNVTGAVNDLQAIAKIAHEQGCVLVADVSQSAGIFPVDVKGMGIDVLCFTGHKGLYGPQGTGGFYVREGIPFVETRFGGTGVESAKIRFSKEELRQFPRFGEPGTQNAAGIAGLLAGVRFVQQTGVETIRKKERQLLLRLMAGMQKIADTYPRAGVRIYCAGEGPVLSFTMEHLSPQDIGYVLAHGYGITVRTGLHCAPLIHEALHTLPQGTVRVSVSWFNTENEIDAFLQAAAEIAKTA